MSGWSDAFTASAHLLRFGGALIMVAGLIADFFSNPFLSFGSMGGAEAVFYAYGASAMFSGIVLEMFYHYLEKEILV